MNDDTGVFYLKPWKVDDTVTGLGGIGKVIQSNNARLNEGDYIQGILYWPWMKDFVVNCDERKDVFEKASF